MKLFQSIMTVVGQRVAQQKHITAVVSAKAIEQALIRANQEAKSLVKH